jgi:hypothetical protein
MSTVTATAIPGAGRLDATKPEGSGTALDTRSPPARQEATEGTEVADATWEAAIQGLARSRRRHDLLSREIGLQLRHAFTIVGEFIVLAHDGAETRALSNVLEDVIRNAHSGFNLAARLHTDTARLSTERNACLTDLGQLRDALNGGNPPTSRELVHSMDALIIQFVRIDVERNKPPGIRRSLPTRFARE